MTCLIQPLLLERTAFNIEGTLLHFPSSPVTNPIWMEAHVKVSLGHGGFLLCLNIYWGAVRATRGRFGDLCLAWQCTEPCGELLGSPYGYGCERSTGSCQQRGGISWSDADRGCLQAAGAQPDWHPVYSQMTYRHGMSVAGILSHLAVWRLLWNAVWWSLCRENIAE